MLPISSTTANDLANTHSMKTRSKSGIFKPKTFLTHTTSTSHIPTFINEALSSPQWLQAMTDEYNALLTNHTWSLTSFPAGAKVVGCKWLFKNKFNVDGSFERHKARLVAKGFSQTAGHNYTDTYSLVVKPATIRLVLSHVISHHWPIHQIDVNNAFLNGELNEDVYMTQPPGFTSTSPHLVCKLHKVLYGLKQAPRAWFHKLSTTLNSLGFHSTKSDTSLFVNFYSTYTIFILIYVDDIIITGSSLVVIQQLISTLSTCFALKDLGPLQFFLGIHVTHLSTGGLHMSQQQYITDLLRRTNTDASYTHANQPSPPKGCFLCHE